MKYRHLFITIVFFIFMMNSSYAVPIDFQKGTWVEIQAKAKKEKKKIFIDAFATWCGPCKKMDANTFSNNEVGEFFNKHFVCYKLDMESPEGRKFGMQYPVGSYPTFLFFDEKINKIAEFKGYRDAVNFLAIAKDIVFPEQSAIYILNKDYQSGKRDKKFLYKFLMAKNDANQPADPKIIGEYFQGIPADSLISSEPFIMFYLFHDSLESAYTNYFIKNYQSLLAIYGNYAAGKVDNLINNNIQIAAKNKDRTHLDKIKKFALQFVEKERAEEFNLQIENIYLQLTSKPK